MNSYPFSAISQNIAISASATPSTGVPLPKPGNTLRVVNEGPNIVFINITPAVTSAPNQLAVLPSGTAATTGIPFIVGDTTATIPNDQIYNISAICRATQTAVLTVAVTEGY